MLSEQQLQQYHHDGYLTVLGLFSQDEVEFFKKHYEAMRQRETQLQKKSPNDTAHDQNDPLVTYPRLMQPHRRDQTSLKWLIDERLNSCMTQLLGSELYASRQCSISNHLVHAARHCMENVCLRAVPGSHTWPVLCVTEVDTNLSFTDVTVPLPDDMEIKPIEMKVGDVFFFNGQIVHGSLPNRSNRFRRVLIGHYIL